MITGVSINTHDCRLYEKADKVKFDVYGTNVNCSDYIQPGTVARVQRRDQYTGAVASNQQLLTCNDNGLWSSAVLQCEPICGVITLESNRTVAPWHVFIYKKNNVTFEYECGGTIINARAILSVAHCLWDINKGTHYETSLLQVATMTTFLGLDIDESPEEQTFEVQGAFFDPSYVGYTLSDKAEIAILVLKKDIVFDSDIRPICISYGFDDEEKAVPINWKGHINGWEKTEGTGAPVELEVTVIDQEKCIADSSPAPKT